MCCLACCPHRILGAESPQQGSGYSRGFGRERTTGECQGLSKNQALEVSPLQPRAQSVLQHLPWPCTFPESCWWLLLSAPGWGNAAKTPPWFVAAVGGEGAGAGRDPGFSPAQPANAASCACLPRGSLPFGVLPSLNVLPRYFCSAPAGLQLCLQPLPTPSSVFLQHHHLLRFTLCYFIYFIFFRLSSL